MSRSSRVLIIAGCLFATIALLSGCSDSDLNDVEHVQRAKDFQDHGDLRASVIELKNAIQKNPENPEARWLLGLTYVEVGDGAAAEKEFKRAVESGLAKEAIIIPLGKALLLQQSFDRVLDEIRPADTLPPADRAAIYALHGNAYIGKGMLDEADQAFHRSTTLLADLASAQTGLARLAALKGDIDQARQWIDRSLVTDPAYAETWSLLGDLESFQGNSAEAETAFSKAIGLRKYPTQDVAKRALARIQLERYADAEADLDSLRKQGFKNHPYVNYVAGVGFFRQEKYREAADAFELSQSALPSFLPAEVYLATTHLKLGNLEQAHSAAARVYAQAPRSLTARRLLGGIEIGRSEFQAASDVLLGSLKEAPDDIVMLRMLATVALLEGDAAAGVRYYQKILSLDPESQDAKDMLMVAKLLDGQSLDHEFEVGVRGDADADEYYKLEFLYAVSAFRDGKIRTALDHAEALRAKFPDKVDPINLMAACYLAGGQWDKAKAALQEVLRLQPKQPSATLNLAKIEYQQGHLDEARTLLKDLVATNPRDERAILLLVEVEARAGRRGAAIRILEKAVEEHPNLLSLRAELAAERLRAGRPLEVLKLTQELRDRQVRDQPRLLELRAKAEMITGDSVAAEASFERWAKISPDSAEAHFLYSDSLARNGKLELARTQLVQAIALDPHYLPAQVGQVKMLVQSGTPDRAKQALVDLRKGFGERPEVLGIEGWYALGSGDYVTAERRLSTALAQRPDRELTLLLSRSLTMQRKYDDAIKVLQAWVQGQPQDLVVLLELADVQLAANRKREAIDTYIEVVRQSPDHIVALNNLAWLHRDIDLKKAIAYAERAFGVAERDPYVLDTYGVLLLMNGQAVEGYRMLQDAARFAPENPDIQLHLGHALMENRRYDEAATVLKALIATAPGSRPATEAEVLLKAIP